MSDETSLIRRGLTGLAALAVAAASLAVLPQPAHTIAADEHVEDAECVDGCEYGKDLCCGNIQPGG